MLVHEAHAVDGPLFCVTHDGNSFPALGPCTLRPPNCVADPAVEHHIHLFYVRAPGDADRYEEVAGSSHWNLADPANLFIPFSSKTDPIAAIAAPGHAPLGAPVQLSAAPSSDPDGDALTRFAWDFGDGTQAYGSEATHRFNAVGDHTVSLTVYDEYEGRSVARHTVSVAANEAPLAAFDLPTHATAGQPVSFDGSASSDPDGSVVSYAWDFGDGRSAVGPVATDTYADAGRALVRLTVTDDSGASATAEAALTVRGR